MTEPPALLWLDLETTGLDPERDCVLEVACILTGPDLKPRWTWSALVRPIVGYPELNAWRDYVETMPPAARAMHERSGLLAEIDDQLVVDFDSLLYAPHEVADFAIDWLRRMAPGEAWMLAGSSPHFDRAFLRRHMPRLDLVLSHRHFDVSVLHRFAEMFAPEHVMPRESEPAHRAMADVRHSLEVARWYRDRLGTVTP